MVPQRRTDCLVKNPTSLFNRTQISSSSEGHRWSRQKSNISTGSQILVPVQPKFNVSIILIAQRRMDRLFKSPTSLFSSAGNVGSSEAYRPSVKNLTSLSTSPKFSYLRRAQTVWLKFKHLHSIEPKLLVP